MIAPDKGQPPIVLHVRTIEPVESFVLAAAPSERLSGLIGATVGKSRNLLLQSLQRFGPMSKRVFSRRYPGELIAAPVL